MPLLPGQIPHLMLRRSDSRQAERRHEAARIRQQRLRRWRRCPGAGRRRSPAWPFETTGRDDCQPAARVNERGGTAQGLARPRPIESDRVGTERRAALARDASSPPEVGVPLLEGRAARATRPYAHAEFRSCDHRMSRLDASWKYAAISVERANLASISSCVVPRRAAPPRKPVRWTSSAHAPVRRSSSAGFRVIAGAGPALPRSRDALRLRRPPARRPLARPPHRAPWRRRNCHRDARSLQPPGRCSRRACPVLRRRPDVRGRAPRRPYIVQSRDQAGFRNRRGVALRLLRVSPDLGRLAHARHDPHRAVDRRADQRVQPARQHGRPGGGTVPHRGHQRPRAPCCPAAPAGRTRPILRCCLDRLPGSSRTTFIPPRSSWATAAASSSG